MDDHRRACREALNLRKELAASRDYEDLQRTAEGLRAQLAALEIGPASDSMGRSFELMRSGEALRVVLDLAPVGG